MATLVRIKKPYVPPAEGEIHDLGDLPVGAAAELPAKAPGEKALSLIVAGKSHAGTVVRIHRGKVVVQPAPGVPPFEANKTQTQQWSNATRVRLLNLPGKEDADPVKPYVAAKLVSRPISLRGADQDKHISPAALLESQGEEKMAKIDLSKLEGKTKAATKQAAPVAKAAPAKEAKAPRVKKEAPEPQPCKCGCGTQVPRTFAPGHDARMYGWLKKVGDGRMKYDELNRHVKSFYPDMRAVKAAVKEHFKAAE